MWSEVIRIVNLDGKYSKEIKYTPTQEEGD